MILWNVVSTLCLWLLYRIKIKFIEPTLNLYELGHFLTSYGIYFIEVARFFDLDFDLDLTFSLISLRPFL